MSESRDSAAGQLTQHQILILRGIVEGKSNHELATEMGFSVSTIRHETMRAHLPGAGRQRPQGSGQEGAHTQPDLGVPLHCGGTLGQAG